MIRLTVLWLSVAGVFVYTWKDWYRGLCGLVVLLAIMEHPDVPKQMLGIPGLNPFNLLLANVIAAWASQRSREGLRWDLPRPVSLLLLLFAGIVVVGFIRMTRADLAFVMLYYDASFANIVSDYLINSIKWVIPALLLYDGCRTEERFRLALISVLAVYVILGLQVAKWMPPTLALDGAALERRGLRVLPSGMGFHRVNLSAMLSGASWAILAARVLLPRGFRWPALLTALFVVYAQVMTGGRAGYAAWVCVGLALSVLKWRRYLLLVPAALAVVFLAAPGIVGRATEGFTEESRDTSVRLDRMRDSGELRREEGSVDSYTVTAGRSIAWPVVISRIVDGPWIGYGRQAMLSSGTGVYIFETYGEAFPHPHNAYLEILFDNGLVGGLPVLGFYALMLFYSIQMFLKGGSETCVAIGGVSTALILSLLVSAMGSQSFYPDEGWVGMWCVMFLMLRVRVERQRLARGDAAVPVEPKPSTLLRPAYAGLRPMVPVTSFRVQSVKPVAPTAPRVSWQPRAARKEKPHGAEAPTSTPTQTVAPQKPRFQPDVPFRLKEGISTIGIFGSEVTDPLVWERA